MEVVPYEPELKEVITRAVKIFIIHICPHILGEFFEPLAVAVAELGREILYVFGLPSAVADNATLVAALVGPEMAVEALRSFLVSLVISGGLTMPGGCASIVMASVLKVSF